MGEVSGDIGILKLLSEQLEDELQSATYVPHLSVHPLFEHLSSVSRITINRLANKAISTKKLARDDMLFQADEAATHMYIVIEGRLNYVRVVSRDSRDERELSEWVDKGED